MDNRRTAVLDSLSDILKRALAGTPAERMGRQAYRFLRRHAATELLSERYDRLTVEIMHQCLSPDSNTVDAGCHNGTLLRHAIARAPLGQHFAFEPLPHLATRLRAKFPGVQTYAVALSDGAGEATFHHVLSDEALSGLQRHAVVPAEAEVRLLTVPTERLDAVLPPECPIAYIKIDVEGGEYPLLMGARQTLARWRPIVIFECGTPVDTLTTTADMLALFTACGMAVWRLSDWLAGRPALSLSAWITAFHAGEFYFLGAPSDSCRTRR